jgi:hypothetical protein
MKLMFATHSDRKRIVTRLFVVEVLNAAKARAHTSGMHEAMDEFRHHGFDLSTDGGHDNVSLDKHIQDVSTRFADCIRQLDGELAGRFHQLASTLSCGDCAKRVGLMPCSGTRQDHDVLAKGGDCMRGVRRLLNKVVETVEERYSALHSGLHATSGLSVRLCIRKLVRSTEGEFGVGASTQLDKTSDRRTCGVVVQIHPAEFGENGYRALPYILFHEVAVHVFHELDDRTSTRTTDASEMFVEGYMDIVAYELAVGWLGTVDAKQFLGSPIAARDAHVSGCEYHSQRYKDSERSLRGAGAPPSLPRNRRAGADAAVSILALIEELTCAVPGLDEGDARDRFLQFSFALNMACGPEVVRQREKFVQYASMWPLTGEGSDDEHSQVVGGLLRGYFSHPDIYVLLHAIDGAIRAS